MVRLVRSVITNVLELLVKHAFNVLLIEPEVFVIFSLSEKERGRFICVAGVMHIVFKLLTLTTTCFKKMRSSSHWLISSHCLSACLSICCPFFRCLSVSVPVPQLICCGCCSN